MSAGALLLLRVSLGLLMIWWGLDKLVNMEHTLFVAEHFYGGVISAEGVWKVAGVLQILLGLLIIAGWLRRFAYPVLMVVTGITMLGVWRSIVDPWAWIFEGSNVLFYPSLIIFAAAWVLWSARAAERWTLDRDAERITSPRAAPLQ